MNNNHVSHTSMSSPFDRSSAAPPTSSSPTRVNQWSVFLDHYEATTGNIRRNLQLLATVRDLPTQQRLVDDVEQDVFDSKHAIESIEQETHNFPYHLRSAAAAQVAQFKQQLEQHYATLIIYQQRHKQGQIVTPQLLQRDQQAAASAVEQSDGADGGGRSAIQLTAVRSPDNQFTGSRTLLDDDNIDDTTRLLSPRAISSSSAYPSPSSTASSPDSLSSARPVTFPMSAQRSSLISTAGHHVDFNDAATRTHSALLQSADIGQETGRLLAQQRESINRQQQALQHSDVWSAESSRSMDRIHCRRISDNLIAWLIVALQIGLFCLIARVKYFS